MTIRRPAPNPKWWRQPTFQDRYEAAVLYGTEFDEYLVLVEHDLEMFFYEDWILCNDCGAGHHEDDSCYRCGKRRHPG